MMLCAKCGDEIRLSGEALAKLEAKFGSKPLEHFHLECLELPACL
jgi:hypothetical protein